MTRKKNRNKKQPAARQKTATLRVTPVKGESTEKVVAVAKGATVESALRAAGIGVLRNNITVDGKPVEFSAPLVAGSIVNVEERPQGS